MRSRTSGRYGAGGGDNLAASEGCLVVVAHPRRSGDWPPSVRCNISSTITLLITSTASKLWPGLIEYSAQRYGGIVECSNSIAHCR